MKLLALLLILLLVPAAARAELPRSVLSEVAAKPPPGARLDLRLAAADSSGGRRTLGDILAGRPAFLVFVDYTCNTLCGTELQLLAAAIGRAHLDPSRFRIVVFGLDPKDTAAAAAAMEDREVPAALRPAAAFLLPKAAVVATATTALGFRYAYDAARDQFAHPAAVYVLAPDGAVRTTLSPFALTGVDLTEALDGARPPTGLFERVRLLCYGYDPATGRYSGRITLLLRLAAATAVAALASAVLLLVRLGRQPR